MKKLTIILFYLFIFYSQQNSNAQVFNIVGCKLPYHTTALGIYNNNLLHSGLDSVCGVGLYDIGQWNGNEWSGLSYQDPIGGSAPILDFTSFQNELIVGSGFYKMGGVLVNKIARWNGTEWRALGTGLNAQLNIEKINCLAVYKGELYAAGKFNEINGLKNVNNIARWDGSTWRRVGTGVQGSLPEIWSMEVYKNELYVGGRFIDAGGITAYSIARWNGIDWQSVGLGTNSNVFKLLTDTLRNILYVSGDFDAVDNSILSRKIASWNGQNWSSMTESKFFGSTVVAMEMYHGYLYAGGYKFSDTCFARWDGYKWEVIDGFNSNITNLQTFKNELYIGGTFTMIGTDSIPYLARYYTQDSVTVGLFKTEKHIQFYIYPNPSDKKINISNSNPSSKDLKLKITNSLGIIVKEIQYKDVDHIEIELPNLANGIFFIDIYDEQKRLLSQRIVISDK